MHVTKKTRRERKKETTLSPKRDEKNPHRKRKKEITLSSKRGEEVTTPWPKKGEEGHGTMVESIENIFKETLWEAWWKAVYPYERDLHNQGDESPDSSDTREWNEFWKIKKATRIEEAKEVLGVDPSVDALRRHALRQYKGAWPAYPNCT